MIKERHEGGKPITVAKRHIGSGIIVLEFCGELRGKFVVSIDWWNSPVAQTFHKIWNWIAAAYGMRPCRIDSSSLHGAFVARKYLRSWLLCLLNELGLLNRVNGGKCCRGIRKVFYFSTNEWLENGSRDVCSSFESAKLNRGCVSLCTCENHRGKERFLLSGTLISSFVNCHVFLFLE